LQAARRIGDILPDKPTALSDKELGAYGRDSGLPSAGTSDKKQKPHKRTHPLCTAAQTCKFSFFLVPIFQLFFKTDGRQSNQKI
jgi:hypothetical protein